MLPCASLIAPVSVNGNEICFGHSLEREVAVENILVLALRSTRVLLKVISGYFAASKKSAVRKCALRASTPVSMLSILAANSTDDFETSASS